MLVDKRAPLPSSNSARSVADIQKFCGYSRSEKGRKIGHRTIASRPPFVLLLLFLHLAEVLMFLVTRTGEPTDAIAILGIADRAAVVLELPLQSGPLGGNVG